MSDSEERDFGDPRLRAFCSPSGPEVFHSVEHRHDIWREDPFDVETIHETARSKFEHMVSQASTPPGQTAGSILLLLGESGAGKTHLMRAFRNYLHGRELGYFGYMQMSSQTDNYARYIVHNLIESLDQPYFEPGGDTTGLMRLSNALVESSIVGRIPVGTGGGSTTPATTVLREWNLTTNQVNDLVSKLSQRVLRQSGYDNVDIDVISALLYLQRNDPLLKNLVLKYLRCEDLSDRQREGLGGIAPKIQEDGPAFMVEQLGRLMWALGCKVLLLCLDQLEDIYNLENATVQFRRAMGAVRDISDRVPSSTIVISCLKDYYEQLKGKLAGPIHYRIEEEPPTPQELVARRSHEETQQLIRYRLRYFYECTNGSFDPERPTYPIPESEVRKLANMTTRRVLDYCRQYRELAVAQGGLPTVPVVVGGDTPDIERRERNASVVALEQAWQDHLAGSAASPSTDPASLTQILAQSINVCSGELDAAGELSAAVDNTYIQLLGWTEPLIVALCNRTPRGGWLARELEDLRTAARGRTMVITRTTDFPKNPRTQIAQLIGELIANGARRTVIQDSEWRAMMAFPEFKKIHGSKPEFGQWQKTERPLTRLPSIQVILGLGEPGYGQPQTPTAGPPDGIGEPAPTRTEPVAVRTPATEPAEVGPGEAPKEKPVPAETGDILAGVSKDKTSKSVTLTPKELTQHAAFLGASGSGKTTVALAIIEQLLLRGIPAILIDRKGDLCCYADDDAWSAPLDNRQQEAHRERLRNSLDVALFTPGASGGRPLLISIVPEGMKEAQDTEREQVAKYAAAAICGMMGYRGKGQDLSRQAILQQAINLLSGELASDQITLERIVTIIDDEDPGLVNLIGRLDTRLFKRLVNDLETLRINKADLLQGKGERLDVEALLGVGRFERQGKTRLSIISTRFLADPRDAEFWVAQLLIAVGRWIGKAPKSDLQALVMFDEADLYLPAIRNPATKEPMENLLKRARSAGLGLFLATQSPGDFDYKCRDTIRTWFLGRVKEDTALKKMRPMLSECPAGVSERLPGQGVGQFHLVREKSAERIKTFPSLIKPIQLPEERILQLARSG